MKMERKQIIKELVEAVGVLTGEKDIFCQNVTKNNNVGRLCIQIPIKNHMRASLPVDNVIKMIEDEKISVEEGASNIVFQFNNRHKGDIEEIDIHELLNDKEALLARVHRAIVNRQRNRQLCEKSPHKDFFDLSVIYRVCPTDSTSFVLSQELMDINGISEIELEEAALKNDREEFQCKPMVNIIAELRGSNPVEVPADHPLAQMLVVYSSKWNYGASYIEDMQTMEKVADRYKADFFILPSSVQEIITIPCEFDGEKACVKDLLKMVRGVNSTQLSDTEVLSDSIYKYNYTEKRLEVIA